MFHLLVLIIVLFVFYLKYIGSLRRVHSYTRWKKLKNKNDSEENIQHLKKHFVGQTGIYLQMTNWETLLMLPLAILNPTLIFVIPLELILHVLTDLHPHN